jgi:hypothetical protein
MSISEYVGRELSRELDKRKDRNSNGIECYQLSLLICKMVKSNWLRVIENARENIWNLE